MVFVFCIVGNQLLMRFSIKAFTFSATIRLDTVPNSNNLQFTVQNCLKAHFPTNFQPTTNRNILIIDPYLCLTLTRLPKMFPWFIFKFVALLALISLFLCVKPIIAEICKEGKWKRRSKTRHNNRKKSKKIMN